MSNFTRVRRTLGIPLDSAGTTPQIERANWVAGRFKLPTVGATLANQHGIRWVVQEHAAIPTYDSLNRWRDGDIQPQEDLYPVIVPQNLSPELMEFFHAIDRCTMKTFAMVDTMPGRRNDGHVPGGNHIDTVCHPATNIIFLDAARVHESVIAHELGHAWVQYVDECEDLRTMKDANDPQRMRMVGFIQSFVLDLKVNELIRRKGFDMRPIDEDRDASLWQLAQALGRGYEPKHSREEVFMALLVADKMIEASSGQSRNLARVNESLEMVRATGVPLACLAKRLAESVERRGFESHPAIVASIDECLLSAFEHCGELFDVDAELIAVNPDEPNHDKFPEWLPALTPKTKTVVGKYMARNDVSSSWSQRLEPSITGRARVYFRSPNNEEVKQVRLNERVGPPNRYSDLPEDIAELLALKHRNQTGRYQTHGGPPWQTSDLSLRPELVPPQVPNPWPATSPQPPAPISPWAPRPYMAGYGRFLTQVRLDEQIAGEHPYSYCLDNPITYVDPGGLQPTIADPKKSGCTKTQLKQIQKALDDLCKNRLQYIKNQTALKCAQNLCHSPVNVFCHTAKDPLCHMSGHPGYHPLPGQPASSGDPCSYAEKPSQGAGSINLCPNAFNEKICGCLGSTILWEAFNDCDKKSWGTAKNYSDSPLCPLSNVPYGPKTPPCP